MADPDKTEKAAPPRAALGRPLVVAAVLLIAAWLAFFDSHSLAKRYRWYRERAHLHAENARLKAEIDGLSAQLDEGLSDEVVERIAREQYGMRRPGETVYRVETKQ